MRIFYQAPVSTTWIRQRPHFIAEGLAERGHDVFWFYAAPLGQCKFRRWNDGRHFSGLEIPILPFATRFRLVAWLNRLWIGLWLHRVKCDIAIFTYPISWEWLPEQIKALPSLFDCMDLLPEFGPSSVRNAMVRAEERLLGDAEEVIASSGFIAEHLSHDYGTVSVKPHVVPNGISVNILLGGREQAREEHDGTLIVYVGTIDAWFDWESLMEAAGAHGDWNFHMVGPVKFRPGKMPANIHLHGAVSHGEACAWMASADILLMPFVRNRLIDAVDPVKMYEYLSAGKPIVSAWWPALDKFSAFPAVSFYRQDPEGMPTLTKAIEDVIKGPRGFAVPIGFLKANSWDVRIDAFHAIIDGLANHGENPN